MGAADRVVDVADGADLNEVMADLGMTEGFDVVMEMSGAPSAYAQLLETVNHGGGVALLGIPARRVPIDLNQVIFKGLRVRGIYGREMFETWYKMANLLQAGMNLDPVITHHLHVDAYEEGFRAMLEGRAGKVILHWG
jgi:threonine 3-dehydrogenase